MDASPDLGDTLEVGGVSVLPGECAAASPDSGGWVRLGVNGHTRRVRVGPGVQMRAVWVDGRRFRIRRGRCP